MVSTDIRNATNSVRLFMEKQNVRDHGSHLYVARDSKIISFRMNFFFMFLVIFCNKTICVCVGSRVCMMSLAQVLQAGFGLLHFMEEGVELGKAELWRREGSGGEGGRDGGREREGGREGWRKRKGGRGGRQG